MNANVLDVGQAYLDALKKRDVAKITSLTHPEIHFKMPFTEVFDQGGFLMAVRRMLANLRDLQVLTRFSSGSQAMFVYEAHFNEPVGTVKVASLMTIEEDKIKEMEVIFDARPFDKVYGTMELRKAA